MRCKNCHTVMMDTDSHCVSCRAPAESATAAPPEQTGDTGLGMLILLPMFGGALGGLAAGLIHAGMNSRSTPARASAPTGTARSIRLWIGAVLTLVGGLFVLLAMLQYHKTRAIAEREPTVATAADLCRKDYPEKAPPWIVYTFTESKPLPDTVTRRRLGYGGEVTAHCLLVRVNDRWLVATVAAGFEGNELVGRLLPVESPSSQALIERVRSSEPHPSAVLPFELNAVDGCESDQHARYTRAGWIGGIALAGAVLGLFLLFSGRGMF